MRSIIFASVALLACAVSANVYAQSVPDMLGPGQVIQGSTGNAFGGTNYVVRNADGSHWLYEGGPRGGLRRIIRFFDPTMDPAKGFTYAVNGGPLIYRPYTPGLAPFNPVDPKVMNHGGGHG